MSLPEATNSSERLSSGREPGWPGKAGAAIALFIVYAALACLTTWPVAASLTTHLPGPSTDTLLHYWNGWQVQNALAGGRSPLHTSLVFYPTGVSLLTHNIAWFNVLPWLALEPLTGGIAAYNLALLLNLTLCGCTLFWLARRLTGDPRAAFVAGVIYLAWPYRLSQLDHPNLLAVEWLPVFFLFLILTIRDGRRRDAVLAGLFFALVGYTRWQQLIPATFMALIYFATALPAVWSPARRYILARLVLAGGVAVALLAPPAALLASEQGSNSSADLLHESDEVLMRTDVMAYLTPAASHSVLARLTSPLYAQYYPERDPERRYPAYIGLAALLLAAAGLIARRRESLPWVLMAIFLLLLALGPALYVGGTPLEVPTFYGLLQPLAIFRLMRDPDRYNVFLALPVAVLAAYGLAALLASRRLQLPRARSLVAGALCVFVVCEYLAIPAPLRDVSSPSPFFTQLAQEPGEFAVINLPFGRLLAKVYMFEQTLHHRPVLEGNLSRPPASAYQYIEANPLLYSLRSSDEIPPALGDVSRQLAAFTRGGIRYIIMHKDLVSKEQLARWRRYLLMTRTYADNNLAVFTTAPEAGRDFTLLQELAPGLGPIKVVTSTTCLNPGRSFVVDVGWGTRLAQSQNLTAAVSLVDAQGVSRQTERFPVSDKWPTSQWPANAIAWGYYPLPVSPLLAAGPYSVTLQLLDPAGQAPGSPMLVASAGVQDSTCEIADAPDAVKVNARFGDGIELAGYEYRQRSGELKLTLYWRGLRAMSTDYAVFVHVFDPATGAILAQSDGMPRGGMFPTTFWWPGDLVPDTLQISLDGLPAGTYRLGLGIYDLATLERLPVIDGQDQPVRDGRLVLADAIQVK